MKTILYIDINYNKIIFNRLIILKKYFILLKMEIYQHKKFIIN
jgi:hypothetical protein